MPASILRLRILQSESTDISEKRRTNKLNHKKLIILNALEALFRSNIQVDDKIRLSHKVAHV